MRFLFATCEKEGVSVVSIAVGGDVQVRERWEPQNGKNVAFFPCSDKPQDLSLFQRSFHFISPCLTNTIATMLATIHSLRHAAPTIKTVTRATRVRLLATQAAKAGRCDEDYIAQTRQLFHDNRPALPRFVVQGESVQPILTPSRFYSEMKVPFEQR
jgi:hypothetical protein